MLESSKSLLFLISCSLLRACSAVNAQVVPPTTTFSAPLLSSGAVSTKTPDWEWVWVNAKVFWEGLQRTYLLSGEESGNGLVFCK